MSSQRRAGMLACIAATLACLAMPQMAPDAHAEGSADLLTSGGNRAWLEYRIDNTQNSTIRRRTIVYTYAQPGETLLVASSANGIGSGYIRVQSPDGSNQRAPVATTVQGKLVGRISDRPQEVIGALPAAAGGYRPYAIPVGAGQGGVWAIHFVSPDTTNTANPPVTAVGAAWTQSNTAGHVAAFDVTVRSAAGSDIDGRSYVNQLAMNVGNAGQAVSAQFRLITYDGFRYLVDMNGVEPFGFNFFANNKGFRDGAGVPLYRSVALSGSSIQDPDAADSPTDVTHKLFFATPAADLPTSAPTPTGTTWLAQPLPTVAGVTGFTFTGSDGTPDQVGSGIGGSFGFVSDGLANFTIGIDLNGDGDYVDAIDRTLSGTALTGPNSIFWDGFDGLGAPAPVSGSPSTVTARIQTQGGEVHFPYVDAEDNPNGIVLQRLNGPGAPDFTVFYNDVALGGASALPPTGASSAAGAHLWSGAFGDIRGMDTWTFVPGANVQLTNTITIRAADLEMVSKSHAPEPLVTGQSATYTFVVRNNGPDSAYAAEVRDTIPTVFLSPVAGTPVVSGGATVLGTNLAGQVFTASVDLPPASTVTFTVTGTVSTTATSPVINRAIILRTDDSGDLDDQGRTGAGNNGRRDTATVVAGPDLTIDKRHTATFVDGTNGSYTFVITNLGGVATSGTITVRDTLPAGLTFVSGAAAPWSFSNSGQVVTATFPNAIASGDSASFTLTVAVGAAAVPSVTNAATVEGGGDTDPGNNRDLDPTPVGGAPDLTIDKRHTAAFDVGSNGTYTVVVSNVGTATSSGTITVRDTLPAGLTFVSGAAAPWSFSNSGQVVTATFPNAIAAGDSVSFTLTVAVSAAALPSVINAASVEGGGDTTPGNNRDTDPTTVGGAPDLTIDKRHTAAFDVGSNGTYTLVVANLGNVASSGTITVRDTLPAGLTFVSGATAPWVFSNSGQVVTATFPNAIAAGDSASFTLTVAVDAAAIPSVINAASVEGGGDTTPGNNRDTDPTAVGGAPDLTIDKRHTAAFNVGSNGTYTVVISNVGNLASSSTITVRDTLPTGLTFVSGATAPWVFSNSGQVVTATFPNAIAAGDSASFTLTVAVGAAAVPSVTNAATVEGGDDTTPGNNRDTDPTTVGGAPDLTIDKRHTAAFNVGSNGTYTVVISNVGNLASSSTITVRDTLPTGLTFVSGATAPWVFSNSGQVVTATFPNAIAAGDSVSFTLTVAVSAAALPSVINAASVEGGGDTTPGNNRDTDPTAVGGAPDLTIDKRHTAAFDVGSNGTYTLVVTNLGNVASSGTITVRDTLPAGLTFVSGAAAPWSFSNSGQVVTATFPNAIAAGDSVSFTLTVAVSAAAIPSVTNAASVEGGGDTTPGNNRDTDPTAVGGAPDLTIDKRHTAAFDVGSNGTYTLVVTNLGNVASSGTITVRDTLPAGLTFVSGAAAPWSFSNSGQVVTATFPNAIAAGDSASFTLTVAVDAAAIPSVTNAASVEGGGDTTPGNNRDTDPTAVGGAPDLTIDKRRTDAITLGQPLSYRIIVTNVGNTRTNDVLIVRDTLATGVMFGAANGVPGWGFVFNDPVLTATYTPFLQPGDSTEFTLSVTPSQSAPIPLINSATVTTPGDSDPGNDRDTDSGIPSGGGLLAIAKSATSSFVEVGGTVEYRVRVSNVGTADLDSVIVDDLLPPGFLYLEGSARITGGSIGDPLGSPGPQLRFSVGTVLASQSRTLSYRLRVGLGAGNGEATNVAVASAPGGGGDTLRSLASAATVRVTGGAFAEDGIIVGKVFADCDCGGDGLQGHEDVGIPGVRVMLEDGTSAITDAEGKYSFNHVRARLHVLRIDPRTLPPGARMQALDHRHALDGMSRFVDLQQGELHRVDFAEGSRDTAVARAIRLRREQGGDARAIAESDSGLVIMPDLPRAEAAGPGQITRVGGSVPSSPLGPHAAFLSVIPAPGDTSAITIETDFGRLVSTDGAPLRDRSAITPGVQRAPREQSGVFRGTLFGVETPPLPQDVRVRTTQGAKQDSLTLQVSRAARPFVMTGLIDALVRLRSQDDAGLGGVVRDGFEDALRDAAISDDDGKLAAGARGALYATGEISPGTQFTARYDSEADPSQRLFRDIRPFEGYDMLGDASTHEWDARSRSRLFARLDRGASFLQFGDLTTPSRDEQRLGANTRSLNGGLGRWSLPQASSVAAQLDVFVSQSRSRQVVDELPGLGISGPYALSNASGLLQSEQVEILVRDRNQPSRILRRTPQTRFADYTIEPFTGRLMFRQPVPMVDPDLNPVSIRVTYESEASGEEFWTYGGTARVQPHGKLALGVAATRDEDPLAPRGLASVDVTLTPLPSLAISAEFARSDSGLSFLGGDTHGQATRGEVRWSHARVNARFSASRVETGFDNPSAGVQVGKQTLSANIGARLAERTSLALYALSTESLMNDGRRDGIDLTLSQMIGTRLRAAAGYRWADETAAPASSATAGLTPLATSSVHGRLESQFNTRMPSSLFAEAEQDLDESRTRFALGGDVQVAPRTRVILRHETIPAFGGPFAMNDAQDLSQTRIGLQSDELRDGHVFSEYRLRSGIAGREAQAAMGLRNRWQVQPGVRVDASIEHVRTQTESAASDEAMSISAGLEVTRNPLTRYTARLEARNSSNASTDLTAVGGVSHKLNRDWTMLGRTAWFLPEDAVSREGRTQLGVAYRPVDHARWNLLARIEDRRTTLSSDASRSSQIATLHADTRPSRRLWITTQLGGKWASEEDGTFESSTDAQLVGARAVLDVAERLDLGLSTRLLTADGFARSRWGLGGEAGWLLARNMRGALGYNVFGFRDDELSALDHTDHGPYLRLGLKFDENLLGLGAEPTGR